MTVGFSKAKKIKESPERFKRIFITYIIALVLAAIPWSFRGLGNWVVLDNTRAKISFVGTAYLFIDIKDIHYLSQIKRLF